MKVVFVHRHFYPSDLPYAQMLREIAEHFSEQGYSVEIIAPCESREAYADRLRWTEQTGIGTQSTIIGSGLGAPLWKKGAQYVYYLLWLIVKMLFVKADLIWVATTPPIFSAAIVRYFKRIRAFEYVYHVQDIHPEASHVLGKIKKGTVYDLLRNIDRKNQEGATAVVTLSTDMENTLILRSEKIVDYRNINNFQRSSLSERSESSGHPLSLTSLIPDLKKDRPIWVFAGTLGHFQNLEFFLDAFLETELGRRPNLVFIGSGALESELKARVQNEDEAAVWFLPRMSSGSVQDILGQADVGVVVLTPGVIGCAYPSKTANYLLAGLQVFAVVEESASLRLDLARLGAGLSGHVSNRSKLIDNIERSSSKWTTEEKRLEIRSKSLDYFGHSKAMEGYSSIVQEHVKRA